MMHEKRKKKNMQISIRKFNETDIEKKIEWINDPRNNRFLHYDLPLDYEKTLNWYYKIKERDDRFDGVIEVDSVPVGLIGLLCIDSSKLSAEFYIALGEQDFKGKGVATKASALLLEKAFKEYRLKKVFLYTEKDNSPAQKLFTKIGFTKKELLQSHIIYNGRKVDRFLYEITSNEFCDYSYPDTKTFAKT